MGDEYTVQGGWDSHEQVVVTLVSAVADCTGRDVLDLDPLYEVVEPEAVEQLFKPRHGDQMRGDRGHIRLTYAGCDVFVTNSEITVRPIEAVENIG